MKNVVRWRQNLTPGKYLSKSAKRVIDWGNLFL